MKIYMWRASGVVGTTNDDIKLIPEKTKIYFLKIYLALLAITPFDTIINEVQGTEKLI